MKKWSATRHEEAPVLALFRGCIPPTHEQALSAPGQDPPRFLQWFSGQLESQSTAVLLSEAKEEEDSSNGQGYSMVPWRSSKMRLNPALAEVSIIPPLLTPVLRDSLKRRARRVISFQVRGRIPLRHALSLPG